MVPVYVMSLALLLTASNATAQRGPEKPTITPAEPCCAITAVDAGTGVVTAKVNATGRTFQFNAPANLRSQVRVGQAIFADAAGSVSVSVDGAVPCCSIVGGPAAAAAAGLTGATGSAATAAAPPTATEAGAAAARPAAAATAEAPKFKAIWEPVPFNKDIDLNAVACVGPETCWVVGSKSTILLTTDGGKTWQVQLGGDPESTDPALLKVFFLDAKHGWAMTSSGKILGTRDGSSWAELSTVSGTSRGLWFQSPQNGFEFENSPQATQRRSADGGKTWTPEGRCSVDTTLGGLPRKLQCTLYAAHFLSPTVGFAGGGAGAAIDGTSGSAFGKTTDGGQTWTMSAIPESKREITAVSFWTEKDGIVVMQRGEEIYWTADGGTTWTRSVTQRMWPSVHGVGEGKIIVGIGTAGGIAYSFNGGRNFTSRPFALPAPPQGLTFPDAQHGYLVGQHGMVFRYRIVPIDYSSPGMIGAMAP